MEKYIFSSQLSGEKWRSSVDCAVCLEKFKMGDISAGYCQIAEFG
jgi:hypothetical protein